MACIALPTAAIIGAVGSGISASVGADAAKSAAATQKQAADAAGERQMAMYEKGKAALTPYAQAGENALSPLLGLAGVQGPGGTGPNPVPMDVLRNLPGYQWQLEQGQRAVTNSYAAKGLANSGAALRGGADYAEGLAGTSYQSLFGNLMQIAGMGGNAASGIANMGLGAQTQANNYAVGGANAQAAGQIGSANALMGGINSAFGGGANTAMLLGLNASGMFAPSNSRTSSTSFSNPGGISQGSTTGMWPGSQGSNALDRYIYGV